MYIICIHSGKKSICYTPNSPNIDMGNFSSPKIDMGNFSLNIQSNKQYGKLHKGFDIISAIFRLVGSSNLRFDDFQIFKYILIFKYICDK